MSFSLLLTALNEYVGDVLVNDCGRPEPARQLSYHGRMPQDCCTENGYLVTSWTEGHPASKFPSGTDNPCVGIPVYTIELRYVVCWSVPEATAKGVTITDDQDAQWNSDALMLADVADCVGRSLTLLTCAIDSVVIGDADEYVDAVREQVKKGWLRYTSTSPIVPGSGCAGVLWQLYGAAQRGPVMS